VSGVLEICFVDIFSKEVLMESEVYILILFCFLIFPVIC
jgi:hypothetical protein